MPLKHLRVCEHCNGAIRWAPCSIGCQVPPDHNRDSWRENLQPGAGTFEAKLP